MLSPLLVYQYFAWKLHNIPLRSCLVSASVQIQSGLFSVNPTTENVTREWQNTTWDEGLGKWERALSCEIESGEYKTIFTEAKEKAMKKVSTYF